MSDAPTGSGPEAADTTRAQAIEAGARAGYERGVDDLTFPAKWEDLTEDHRELHRRRIAAAYDAMAPIIVRATRRQVCREEGHREIETTTPGQVEHQIRCGRCGDEWTRPREILVAESRIDEVARDGGQARFAFAEPQGGCELRAMPRDPERNAAVLDLMAAWYSGRKPNELHIAGAEEYLALRAKAVVDWTPRTVELPPDVVQVAAYQPVTEEQA